MKSRKASTNMTGWTLLPLLPLHHGARALEPAAAKLQHDLDDAIREVKAEFTIPSAEYVFGNSSLIIHSAKDLAITAEPGCQRVCVIVGKCLCVGGILFNLGQAMKSKKYFYYCL